MGQVKESSKSGKDQESLIFVSSGCLAAVGGFLFLGGGLGAGPYL